MNPSAEPPQHECQRSRSLSDYVRDEPVTSLAIAAGVGFIVGGGANTRPGLALLALIGRFAVREAATHFIVGVLSNDDRTK